MTYTTKKRSRLVVATSLAMTGLLSFLSGCGGAQKEKEPVVSVQTTPAARGPIAQTVSAEAVVFPV
jgi:multidrug efflux pump subunit AcrA (membrane-fusion protein)